jgi:O-antigen/teichoic acid export membrane protein
LFSKIIKEGQFLNSVSGVGLRAVTGLVRVGILLGIARAYGPELFGRLSLSISIIEILRMFSEFGVDTVSIRRFTQTDPERRTALLETVLGTKFLLSALFYVVGTTAVILLARDRFDILIVIVVGLSLFFSNGLGALSSYLQSCFSMSRILGTGALSSVVSIGFAWFAIRHKAPLLLVIVALPLGDALNLVLCYLATKLPLRVRFDTKETLSLLRDSLPVGITSALIILYFRLDTLFVFRFAGAAALGLYSACFRMIEPALVIPHAFSTTAYTVLSHVERNDDGFSVVAKTVLRTMWPAYAIVGSFALFLLLLGKALLARFFPMYLSAYPIMAILSLTLVVRSLNVGLTAIFNSRAQYFAITKIAAVNLLVNIVLVLFLTKAYGAVGAAFAALMTESINTLMQIRGLFSFLRFPSRTLVARKIDLGA